jgi:dTDP-4-amino-4,6-dideoxygalactose transaminase
VRGFESEFASYCHAKHAIGVGSGTDALHLALRCCGIGAGDQVATVSNTAVATVAAIELAGATPVLLDVDPSTYTLDAKSLASAVQSLGSSLRAVIPVHLYGHPADMKSIMDIAARHRLVVIEDCAQAHGASLDGNRVGSWGHMSAFSFYPTKNLGALGDAGAVITNDAQLADKARLLQQYGWQQRYISKLAGMNTRLDEVQAAVLRVKLAYLDQDNARRREIASIYDEQLRGVPGVTPPAHAPGVVHAFHQYTLRTNRRDALLGELQKHRIGASVLYPQPIHFQEAYRDRILVANGELNATEALAREILCLPVHPTLSDEQVQFVVQSIRSYCGALQDTSF